MYGMLCQYSRWGPVSSEKHAPAAEAAADGGGGDAAGVVPATVVGVYRALSASLPAIIRLANSANVWRLRTCRRLYVRDTIPDGPLIATIAYTYGSRRGDTRTFHTPVLSPNRSHVWSHQFFCCQW